MEEIYVHQMQASDDKLENDEPFQYRDISSLKPIPTHYSLDSNKIIDTDEKLNDKEDLNFTDEREGGISSDLVSQIRLMTRQSADIMTMV